MRFVSDNDRAEDEQHHDERDDGRFGQPRHVPEHAQRRRDENRGHCDDKGSVYKYRVVRQREQPCYHFRQGVPDDYVVAYHRCKKN